MTCFCSFFGGNYRQQKDISKLTDLYKLYHFIFADRHAGASEEEKKEHEKKFKEVGEAYGVLSDTKKRTRYDQGHDVDDLEGHGHGFGADIDPNQIFQVLYFLKKQNKIYS